MNTKKNRDRMPEITFGKATLVVIVLIAIIFLGFVVLNFDTKVTFTMTAVAVGLMLVAYGFKSESVLKWFADGARSAIDVIIILMCVGTVIGTWMASGVVPTIIYYGLKLLTPTSFMLVGFFICCLVSFFIGSSYSTLATLGVAFMGIGAGLGMNLGLVGGMVVSGALFGDKMSPFSDTTNLAPAVSGTTVWEHIGSMIYTVTPAMIICVVLYGILGSRYSTSGADLSLADEMMEAVKANFNPTPVLFLVPLMVLVLAILKVPSAPALLASSAFAIILGAITQPFGAITIINSLGNGFAIETGSADLDRLVNRGGIASMMECIAWTILTLGMGQMLKDAGVLNAFLSKLMIFIKKKRDCVIATLIFSLCTSMLTAAQYLAIMLPGMLMRDTYTKFKLDKKVLSRTLEDGGTMFSFLVPWDTAGIYTASVLGISTLTYAPYAFLLIACPIIAVIYACVGFAQFPAKDEAECSSEAAANA